MYSSAISFCFSINRSLIQARRINKISTRNSSEKFLFVSSPLQASSFVYTLLAIMTLTKSAFGKTEVLPTTTATANNQQRRIVNTTILFDTINNNNNNNSSNPGNPAEMTVITKPTVVGPSKKPEQAAKIIQQSNIICFDVDSTVIEEEGIDELANFCGKGGEVKRVTKEAMGGSMTFQDALKIRLNIIRPTQKQIADFIRLRPSILTRNVKAFIEHLRSAGKQVYLVSGGFDCLIAPVAEELNIPLTNLFANKLMFYFNGEYASFDTTQPTSRSGGKAEAISIIKAQYPDAIVTMIGDGATDLEAVPPANYFIGFGGNVLREEVFNRAQYYVSDFKQLM